MSISIKTSDGIIKVANVGGSGSGGNASIWEGTKSEFEAQVNQIEDGTLLNITDDVEAIGDIDALVDAINGESVATVFDAEDIAYTDDKTVKDAINDLKIDYSTEEINTGIKWVDGKTIYQITIHPNLTVDTWDSFSLDDSIETLIDIKGTVTWSNGNSFPANCCISTKLDSWQVFFLNSDNNNIGYYIKYSNLSFSSCSLTLYYTKVGD